LDTAVNVSNQAGIRFVGITYILALDAGQSAFIEIRSVQIIESISRFALSN